MQTSIGIASLIVLFVLVSIYFIRRVVIFEFQNGLLYRNGRYVRTLKPGQYWYLHQWYSIQKVEMREINVTIPGQELLTSDNISLKISAAVGYKVADPYLAINSAVSYQESLYQTVQLNLRDVVASSGVDELLAKRAEIGKALFDKTSEKTAALGLQLLLVEIKDVMFPGELKNVFAQVVNAKKEGLAALERARGESTALRNLANAAKLFENNPDLRQLRLFQVLEKKNGNAVVLISPDGNLDIKQTRGNKPIKK